MQLQGIVFIQLQGNDILVNCQGNTYSFKEHIFIHKKYNHSNILTRNCINFKETYQFAQGNISSFNENIHSGNLYPVKEICSLNPALH